MQKEVKTAEADENLINLNPNSNVKQTVYAYDANGNQITKTAEGKTETNTYDGLNQLIGFNDGETTASYKYNANGLRYEKTVDGQKINHVWDGNKQIVADVVDNQFYEADCYIRGTNLVAKYNYCNGNKSEYTYYTQNAHGDVVNLTDSTGAVTKTYKYDAFGVEKNIDDGDTNAFRYCGEYFDKETATVYLRARYYNPATGRFISRDSYAGKLNDPLSLNLYTYCANNPVIYIDPSGHKKGDTFETMDEAAKDFAINYNPKSIEENVEYSTTIYKVKEKVTTNKYVKLNVFDILGFDSNLFLGSDSLVFTFKVKETKEVTMYTYKKVKKGDGHSSNPPWAPIFKRKSAVAHTHGAYDPKYKSDEFSEDDLEYSLNKGVPIYVATPSGTLRKYDPNNYVYGVDNSEEICDDIPYDPNHPDVKNKNNDEEKT